MGTSSIKGSFSIAILNNQRVCIHIYRERVAWVCKPIIPVLTGVKNQGVERNQRWRGLAAQMMCKSCWRSLGLCVTWISNIKQAGRLRVHRRVCVWLLVGYKSSLAKPDKACLIGRIALRGTQQVSVAPGYGVFFHVQWHSCAILTRRIAVAWMLAAWWPFVSPKRGCPAPWRRSPNGLQ